MNATRIFASGARVRDRPGRNNSICIRFKSVGAERNRTTRELAKTDFLFKEFNEKRCCIGALIQGSPISIEQRYIEEYSGLSPRPASILQYQDIHRRFFFLCMHALELDP